MGRKFYILFAIFFIFALSVLMWTNRDKSVKVNETAKEYAQQNARVARNSRPFLFSSSSVSNHLVALRIASLNLDLGNQGAINQVINNVMLEKLHYCRWIRQENSDVLAYTKEGKAEGYIIFTADPSNLEATAVMLNLAEWVAARDIESNFCFIFGSAKLVPSIRLIINVEKVNGGSLLGVFSRVSTQRLARNLALIDGCELETKLIGERDVDCVWLRNKDEKGELNLDGLAKLTAFLSYIAKNYD